MGLLGMSSTLPTVTGDTSLNLSREGGLTKWFVRADLQNGAKGNLNGLLENREIESLTFRMQSGRSTTELIPHFAENLETV